MESSIGNFIYWILYPDRIRNFWKKKFYVGNTWKSKYFLWSKLKLFTEMAQFQFYKPVAVSERYSKSFQTGDMTGQFKYSQNS